MKSTYDLSIRVVVLALVFMTSCAADRDLQSIAVTPTTGQISSPGAKVQFAATGHFSRGASTEDMTSSVTWASANPGIATVSAGGLATAVAFGTTTVTASSTAGRGGAVVSGQASLTVDAMVNVSVNRAGTAANGGSIVSAPAGINCGTTCAAQFPLAGSVSLTASPLPPPAVPFTSVVWTGCDSVAGFTCQINSLTVVRAVTATLQ